MDRTVRGVFITLVVCGLSCCLGADSSDSNTQPTKTDSPPAAAAQCTGDDLSPDVNTVSTSSEY